MRGGDVLRGVPRHRSGQREGFDVQDGHRASVRPQRAGHLQPDEPGPDDDRLPGGAGALPQGQRVVEGAQRADAVEVGSGHGQRPVARPGGQHQGPVGQLAAVVQHDLPGPAVDAGDPGRGADLHVSLGEEVGAAQRQRLGQAPAGGEHLFGQRRALVGSPALGRDERERAGIPQVAQRVDQLHGRLTAADDDDARAFALAR